MKICLFDPAIENHENSPSTNLGDLIIGDAVRRELRLTFGSAPVYTLTTQAYPTWRHLLEIRKCSHRIVGGTNLLSSNMDTYRQWKIKSWQAPLIKETILLGVGWWQYQEEPNSFTRRLLRRALSSTHLHSVRDEYTKKKLLAMGFENVINTGCPTMWPLAAIPAKDIPTRKSDAVLLMLTDYFPEPVGDKKLIELLKREYKRVYFWPQGRGDLKYLSQLEVDVNCLEHSMASLERFLKETVAFDFIGTRLHGGIRCLLDRRRALVLVVDNRAREIANNTGLPTAARDDIDGIAAWINSANETVIRIDTKAIETWRAQFKE